MKNEYSSEHLTDCDVLVVGGGFPGICAAIAAGRLGAKTVLIERNAVIGGQAAEIDTWGLDGFLDIDGKLLISGIPWEILTKAVAQGQSDPLFTRIDYELMAREGIEAALIKADIPEYVPYIHQDSFMNAFNDQYVNPNAYRYVAQTLLEEAGVQILYQMPVIDVIVQGSKLNGVVVMGENGTKYDIMAKRIVDTSQSASVCTFAGKPFPYSASYMGALVRVAGVDIPKTIDFIRSNPDEDWLLRPMRDKKADPDEMDRLVKGGNPLFIHGFMKMLDKAIADNSMFTSLRRTNGDPLFFFYERDGMGVYPTFGDEIAHVDVADPMDYSRAVSAARKQQWLMHRFFHDYIPGFENAHLMDVYGNISKAINMSDEPGGFTEYDITRKDLCGETDRTDIITLLRGHPHCGQNEHGWGLPMASLIPKGLDNILVTGKPACRMIHYIGTCAKVGEAAGAAAAVSALNGTPLRETSADLVRERIG